MLKLSANKHLLTLRLTKLSRKLSWPWNTIKMLLLYFHNTYMDNELSTLTFFSWELSSQAFFLITVMCQVNWVSKMCFLTLFLRRCCVSLVSWELLTSCDSAASWRPLMSICCWRTVTKDWTDATSSLLTLWPVSANQFNTKDIQWTSDKWTHEFT